MARSKNLSITTNRAARKGHAAGSKAKAIAAKLGGSIEDVKRLRGHNPYSESVKASACLDNFNASCE